MIRSFLCPLFLAFFALFLSIVPSSAAADLRIPPEYGEVVCRFNEKSPNQLFIIGMSHKDALLRINGANTSRVQAEVYKIGDWLIRNHQLDLLLPEGFFKSDKPKVEKTNVKPASTQPLDIKTLEELFADNRTFVPAEKLLKAYHPLKLQQVEDKRNYFAVAEGIDKLVSSGRDSAEYFMLKSDLDYLQDRRTAAMLQKIPEIVNDEFRQGNIKSKKAIFTIGMSHLLGIIKCLNENRIAIPAPLLSRTKVEDYIADLSLSKENFGVCVIIPKTLANDQKILEANRLEKVVAAFRKQASLPLQ